MTSGKSFLVTPHRQKLEIKVYTKYTKGAALHLFLFYSLVRKIIRTKLKWFPAVILNVEQVGLS